MTHLGWVKRLLIFLGVAAAATVVLPPAHGAGHRLVTHVTRPVEVNGHLYPAGELSVRQVGTYSPTSTLNEVWVGGECLGLLLAEARAGSQQASGDALEFEVDHRGHLVLVGFSYRGQDSRELFRPRTMAADPRVRVRAGATAEATSAVALK